MRAPTMQAPTDGRAPIAQARSATRIVIGSATETGASGRPRRPATQPIDSEAVRVLSGRVGTTLVHRLREGRPAMFPPDPHAVARERAEITAELVGRHAEALRRDGRAIPPADEYALLAAVRADLKGLDRLLALRADSTVEEVHVIGCDPVRITRRNGTVELGEPIANSDDDMVSVLRTLARHSGVVDALSGAEPALELRMPGGDRLSAICRAGQRPYAVIRQCGALDVTLNDLTGQRADGSVDLTLDPMIDPMMRDFLRAAVAAGLNIVVAGRAGSGKTTLLRALASEIPADEPFILLEESSELGLDQDLHHHWKMSFDNDPSESDAGGPGRTAITTADLIPISVRMGTQRIVVGDVRSPEIVPMLEAMAISRGSMCTLDARTAASVGDRIVQLALSGRPTMTAELAQRMVASGVDLIVYVNLVDETGTGGRKRRCVSSIAEVTGVGVGGWISLTTVFGPRADGRTAPVHLPDRLTGELAAVGYDARAALSSQIPGRRGANRRHDTGDQHSARHAPYRC